jgi:SAM-dependent methyltransferase
VHEILRHLQAGARVLDLGSAGGSFGAHEFPAVLSVRVDLEFPRVKCDPFVQADAARLPFPDAVFDAVISNHSLEHFSHLDLALQEIGRVLKPGAALFVSVPDASTLTDKIYRTVGRGGGHLNPFVSAEALTARIQTVTALPLAGRRLLFTSMLFLNSKNPSSPVMVSLSKLDLDTEQPLALFIWLLRTMDRVFGTRTSVYGWAFYFGKLHEAIDGHGWCNVCVRCGAAHASTFLQTQDCVTGRFFKWYSCPSCGAKNMFTCDEGMRNVV